MAMRFGWIRGAPEVINSTTVSCDPQVTLLKQIVPYSAWHRIIFNSPYARLIFQYKLSRFRTGLVCKLDPAYMTRYLQDRQDGVSALPCASSGVSTISAVCWEMCSLNDLKHKTAFCTARVPNIHVSVAATRCQYQWSRGMGAPLVLSPQVNKFA